MLTYYDGTVFNANTKAIVNTINCDGFMGAGLALEFGLRFPKMLNDYENKCKKCLLNVGKVDFFIENDIIIINFPTKNNFKFPSQIKWIEEGLKNFVQTYKEQGITSVAFPKLGCSNGGLNFSEVKNLMEKYLSDLDTDVVICLDEMSDAKGIELEMLTRFNEHSISDLAKIIRLTDKQKENLKAGKQFKRFWHISKVSSIGAKTYSDIFKYFYEVSQNKNEVIQTKLF